MSVPNNFTLSFRDIYLDQKHGVILVAGHDDSTEKRVPTSKVLSFDGKGWSSVSVPFVTTSVCVLPGSENDVLVMGVGGGILRLKSGVVSEEIIDSTDRGPQNYGDLTEIRVIGRRAYVVGMCRTVYRCDGVDYWKGIDMGVRTTEDDDSDAGFTSIDGFSESDIYAVGWDGEIWHYDGEVWEEIESPTNLILFRVVCGKDGKVYACGQKGIVVCGREKVWEVVKQEETREKFWGATWFKGHLYLSTSKGIYLIQDGMVCPISIKSSDELLFIKNMSFYRLESNDSYLWSVGRKMILYTSDGENWSEPSYSIEN